MQDPIVPPPPQNGLEPGECCDPKLRVIMVAKMGKVGGMLSLGAAEGRHAFRAFGMPTRRYAA